MGGHNSKADQLHYDAKEWQEVEKSTIYEVMRNKKGQQANLYHFSIKSQRQLQEQVDIYHRRRNAANWVQVLGANVQSSGFGFCGSRENACVLTQRIPVLLNSISRLNKQQAAVVLYNALRGFNDIGRIVVPGPITDKMVGFTKQGQTKVWVNENFGMNYPSHIVQDAVLNESQVVANLVNAISPKTDLTPDFINALRSSGSFSNALNFIRSNGGVAENVLEGNRINVSNYFGTTSNVQILRDTTPVQNVINATTTTVVPQQTTSTWNQPIGYQPVVGQTVVSGYRNPSVHFVHNPVGTSSTFVGQPTTYQPSYQIPNRYVQTVGTTNKYSFTTAQ